MAGSYDASIRLLVSGASSLDRVYNRLEQFSSQLQRINATPIDIGRTIGRGAAADRLGVLQRQIQNLRNDYLELGEAQRRFANGSRTGNAVGMNATINQLRAQADLLKTIANNSRVASVQFREMTVASAMASSQANVLGRERLAVLAEAFSSAGPRTRMANVRGDASLQLVDRLVAALPTITRSEAGLQAYKSELEDIRALVPILSGEYRMLEEAIASVNMELSSAGLRGQTSQITPRLGPATEIYSEKGARQRFAFEQKIAEEQYKQLTLGQKIAQANLDDVQKTQLRNRLSQASNAIDEKRIEDAQILTREIDNQRIALERVNRSGPGFQEFGALGTGFMPVSGQMPGAGGKSKGAVIPGSPAAKELERKSIADMESATGKLESIFNKLRDSSLEGDDLVEYENSLKNVVRVGEARLNQLKEEDKLLAKKIRDLDRGTPTRTIGGQALRSQLSAPIDAPRRQFAIYQASENLLLNLNTLEIQGFNVAEEKLKISQLQSQIEENTLNLSNQLLASEEQVLATVKAQISNYQKRQKLINTGKQNAISSPIQGGINFPGSPIFKQTPFLERRFGRRGSAAISEGLIGGAFPLLFGQGPAAALGGGLGGALGGFAGGGLGFGFSLIGTALGDAVTQLQNAAVDTAKSLRDPITNFEKLADTGLLASKAQEQQIRNLIEYGNSAKAASIIQEELSKKIGVLGMRDMANLDEQSVKLSKAWAELNVQMQAAISGPLAGLLEWAAKIIEGFNAGNQREAQRKDFMASLPEDARKEFNRRRALNLYSATGESDASLMREFRSAAIPLQPPSVKIDPQKAQEEADKRRQEDRSKEDALLQRKRQTEDFVRSSREQIRQFDYQVIDLQRQATDYNRKIKEDIFNKEQQIQRDQISNDRLRRQITIDTVDLEYRRKIANEDGRAAAVLAAEADLMKVRSTNEADIEAAKRNLEIDIAKQKRDTENYIYGLAREADSIRRATLKYELDVEDYKLKAAREIEDIYMNINRQQQDTATRAQKLGMAGAEAGVKVEPGTLMDKDVLRKWLQSRGFGRTTGDFTNAGHETPNHMLNAMDMGILGGSDAEALRKTTAMEILLRNTGAFGNQLFGPISDPYGHGAGKGGQNIHLHIPTPGGKIRVNQALANLMGLGIGDQMAAPSSPTPSFSDTGIEAARRNVNALSGRPQIAPLPVSSVRSTTEALDAQNVKIKEEEIKYREKLAQIGESAALQRVIEAAEGEKVVKQRKRELEFAVAERNAIGAMSADKQEIATFDARALVTIEQTERMNKEILENTKLTGEEKKKLEEATKTALANTRATLAIEKEMIAIQQQRRFGAELANLQLQTQTRGAGVGAGFFGGAAQKFEQEMMQSGDIGQATQLAQATRALEIKDQIVQMQENLKMLLDPTYQVIEGAKAMGSAFGDSFKGVISGSMSAQEALANFFQRTADHFLDMAAQILTQQVVLKLIGFGLNILNPFSSSVNLGEGFTGAEAIGAAGARAMGGPVTGGLPYLVGEKGPELFVPGSSGKIVPNHQLGGGDISVMVNVDASGSSVQGDDQKSSELGRVIATAVQQELLKQKRPGGILTR